MPVQNVSKTGQVLAADQITFFVFECLFVQHHESWKMKSSLEIMCISLIHIIKKQGISYTDIEEKVSVILWRAKTKHCAITPASLTACDAFLS